MKIRIIIAIVGVFCLTGFSSAKFMKPKPIPLERIVKNTKAYIEAHPDDPEGYYTLGRIYYLGFVNKTSSVPGFDEGRNGQPPRVAPDWMTGGFSYQLVHAEAEKRALKEMGIADPPAYSSEKWARFQKLQQEHEAKLREEKWKPEAIPSDTALQYASDAKTYLKKAIELDTSNALYSLGMASLNEQVFEYLTTNKLESSVFPDLGKDYLLDGYWKAFDLSQGEDAKLNRRPVSGIASLVSVEAGKAWLRLGGADEQRTKEIQNHLEKMDNLKMGAITPLVITDAVKQKPGDFALPDTLISFDLDGEGQTEDWEWVTPETGFLVWDPQDLRDIRSGAQMFGNYTFQIIWRDGFRALSVLDDDMDGVIAGDELNGLSVWYDRNLNGISENSEVVPVQTEGITSLTYENPDTCEGVLVRRFGVAYSNGSAAHLWDWISYTKD